MAYLSHFCYNLSIESPWKEVAELTEFEKVLLQKLEEKDHLIASLQSVISSMQASINELNQTIAALKEQLKKNSNNSSKPPSSDGYRKPTPKSLRESSGKQQGGQKDHPGSYLSVCAEPDQIMPHMPTVCESCPRYEECKGASRVAEQRTVIDITVDVNLCEHQALSVDCPIHGMSMKGEFPADVRGPLQYGQNLQALVVSLNTVGALGIHRIHEILGSVFNIPLSTGVIATMTSRCADAVSDAVSQIRQKVSDSALAHFDETGTRIEGKTCWVHAACNDKYTFLYAHRKRGAPAMEDGRVLPDFHGIAVHDCWKPYWTYGDILHAVCNAHILRELVNVIENHPEQTWAPAFKKLLLDMLKAKEKAIAKGKESLSYYHLHKFSRTYDSIIETGSLENPLPESQPGKRGRKKRGKVLALVERLRDYKASVCLFVENFCVPFSNNQAEQDIRILKIKTKVSGCFRTWTGADDYLKIMSYVGTAKKHGINPFQAIKQAISGRIQLFAN